MLESAKVTLDLKEFDSLRKDSDSFRVLARAISSCCQINYDEYHETGNVEDTKVIIDKKKLENIAIQFSCWGKEDEIETNEVKVEYK